MINNVFSSKCMYVWKKDLKHLKYWNILLSQPLCGLSLWLLSLSGLSLLLSRDDVFCSGKRITF